ncbi:ABC transporter substrate-binding protein, partial [Intestinibacter sp.]
MKIFKRIKKAMVATLIAAMTLGVVTGCSSSGGSSGGDSKTLNFGCTNFSDSLDPTSATNGAWAVSRYGIGETLYRFDQQMQPQPYLADSVKSNDDKTEWTFHIKEGIKFSNGNELTATAVKKSLDYTFKQEKDGKGSA